MASNRCMFPTEAPVFSKGRPLVETAGQAGQRSSSRSKRSRLPIAAPLSANEASRATMAKMSPPILLTVDDDPEVSRALARDLRQQYGEDYRIRRAESGPAALDALKELKLRDEQVGLVIADQRMPAMSGVEFLEQSRSLYPKARRVLLTAYADTDAAIAA